MLTSMGSAVPVSDLQRRLAAVEAQLAKERAERKAAEDALAVSEQARERLERIIASLNHAVWGARSEKRHADQDRLPLFEDIAVAEGMLAEAQEKADAATGRQRRKPQPTNRNLGHLPKHLERFEKVIEPESTECPCGCGEMMKVGEDRTERLDVVPAKLRVLVTIRPKYICRACEGKQSAQAPAPEYLVPRGLPTEALVAHTLVAKFADHQPFYRQSEAYRREGIDLDRTMLGNWAGRGMQVLAPVIDRMIEHLKASDGLFMDETTVPVMAPGTGKTRLDYLWAIARDQRGYGGADPPIVVFHHSRHRSAKVALELMRGYTGGGPLHVDGYRVYDALGDPKQTVSPWVLAYCWTHWRRRFVDFQRATESPLCEEILERIAALYRIEAMVRGHPPELRLKARQELSAPIVEAMRPWLEAQLDRLSSASELAKHIRYALKRWDGLCRFLHDERIEMDTNPIENLIRPVKLTKKNALFAGSDDGARTWARCASLIGTCKLNGVNPQVYLTDTLRRIVDMHPVSRIDELMPWNFAPTIPSVTRQQG